MLRAVLLVFLLCKMVCAAELNLPSVFSDHMVLQRDRAVPVWGKAESGATVTIEFDGQTKTATAGSGGKWQVTLDPMPANASPQVLTVRSSASPGDIAFSDVLVGEVWLCSGQSNMELALKHTENAQSVIASAHHPLIRLYDTPRACSEVPQERINSGWTTCTPETAESFSAVAYYFGRKLQQDLNVPVGLLESSWSNTRITPWTPLCGLKGVASLRDIYLKAKNLPKLGGKPDSDRHFPTALYNGMIHAHIPFAIRGVIWYQGEANRRDGMLYVDKTKALVNSWRSLWGDDFPFYFVQIAPFKYNSGGSDILPAFWEAQTEIIKAIPNAGMAVISDAAMLDNIHPTNKEVPGTRLALLAEAGTYGMDVVSTGPVFEAMKINGNKIIVTFSSADGLSTRDGKAPDWFEISGSDGVFKPAHAEIEGCCIVLSSPDVERPSAMRFAWDEGAIPNLVNGSGLPAGAFRAGKTR